MILIKHLIVDYPKAVFEFPFIVDAFSMFMNMHFLCLSYFFFNFKTNPAPHNSLDSPLT